MMRAWLPLVLTVPFALGGCPALLSDWTINGGGAVDASVDAAPEAAGDSAGSGASSGSSGGSSSGGSGGATSSGGSGGSSGLGGSSGAGGSSSSGCSSGTARCSSTIPTLRQTCVAGAWVDDSAACSGNTPVCFSGVCVTCDPGAMQCASGTQPQLCVSGAWTDGSACSGSSSVCLDGACVACTPGATQCVGGTQPQTCSASGTWQNQGSPVTHSNGLGQTWQDCVPLGTYNEEQAMKACKASGAAQCTDSQGCGAGNFVVIGRNADGSQIVGAWGYGGQVDGFACNSATTCSGCPSSGQTWS